MMPTGPKSWITSTPRCDWCRDAPRARLLATAPRRPLDKSGVAEDIFDGRLAHVEQRPLRCRHSTQAPSSSLLRQGGSAAQAPQDDTTLRQALHSRAFWGANTEALARRSAYCVDRILKGAKPGDLPIELPTTFELVPNMKAAEMLGITIAPPQRARWLEPRNATRYTAP